MRRNQHAPDPEELHCGHMDVTPCFQADDAGRQTQRRAEPAVTSSATGLPCRLVRMWSFVLNLPRLASAGAIPPSVQVDRLQAPDQWW
jgi:hypothetical protein